VAKNLAAKYGESWVNPSDRTDRDGNVSAAAEPPKVGALSKAQIKHELQKAVKPEPAGSRV